MRQQQLQIQIQTANGTVTNATNSAGTLVSDDTTLMQVLVYM